MALLLRIPRKRKERPVSFVQVELVSNKVAKKQTEFSNEDSVVDSKCVKKRLFTHVLTVEDGKVQDVEPYKESWSSNKRHASARNIVQEKISQETTDNILPEWKVLDLIDNFQSESSFTLNDDVLVKEYVGELAEDPFKTSKSEELVYDLYELCDAREYPSVEEGPSIRVLADNLDEYWFLADEKEDLEDVYSSDSNRTYDYPETPESSTGEESNPSEDWYDDTEEEEDDDECDDVADLWKTKRLIRKLQATTLYDSSSSSSYNSQDSGADFKFE
ncbi:hypothetical protein GAYE_SCF07G2916 [Galdieria yellowstonensis]|uniref:Transcription factor Iwr1 domain-containing protein n=1 Tax=Galdieria yellowstonensis TaxID=3028027 RepID=A0AAV9IC93_9RHOD|nr:hypothetical protein GAYE_SCF07G2916 [Galdieria yellowstonensis]